jgi:hypothetical protein
VLLTYAGRKLSLVLQRRGGVYEPLKNQGWLTTARTWDQRIMSPPALNAHQEETACSEKNNVPGKQGACDFSPFVQAIQRHRQG